MIMHATSDSRILQRFFQEHKGNWPAKMDESDSYSPQGLLNESADQILAVEKVTLINKV